MWTLATATATATATVRTQRHVLRRCMCHGGPDPPSSWGPKGYFKLYNPAGYEFAQRVHVNKKIKSWEKPKTMPLMSHLMSYERKAYTNGNNVFLVDPEAAETIAKKMIQHSERDEITTLVDVDGGFCLVSQKLLEEKAFRGAVKICVKDELLEPLHEEAKATALSPYLDRITFPRLNLNMCTAKDFMDELNDDLASRLTHIQSSEARPWEAQAPPYTVFGNVTYGTLHYFLRQCIQRDNCLSQFSRGRAEFFFLVNSQTCDKLIHPEQQYFPYLLFQTFFTVEHLLSLPRTSFIPSKLKRRAKIKFGPYSDEDIHLVKMRPRIELGILPGTDSHQLLHFLQLLCLHSKTLILPEVERLIPGVGLDFVLQTDFDVMSKGHDLSRLELIKLFNIFASHPHFKNSNFVQSVAEETKNYALDKITCLKEEGNNSIQEDRMMLELRREHGKEG